MHTKLTGPIQHAFKSWSRTAKKLSQSGASAFKDLGAQAMCVSGQIGAAFGAVADVNVSISVSVEASASVGGAAGASM